MSNAGNIRRFDRDLHKFAKDVDVAVELVTVKIALDIHTKFSNRNPVLTGRSRAGWDVKESAPSGYVPPKGFYTSPRSIAESGLTGKTIIFVTNAVHYIHQLNKGSSNQAPAGIVDISLAEINVALDAIVARVRNS